MHLFIRMGRKSDSLASNRAPDLRIRRSDVLQQSCREFYGEPAKLFLRPNVTRVLDTLDPFECITDSKLKHSGENNNIVTNKWLMSPGVRRRVRRRRENKVNGARSFTSDCKGNIKTLDMRHYNTFEGSVDAKGQCVENYYWISLLNKIMINLKESLFFQPNSV